jgi:hypothetical protein
MTTELLHRLATGLPRFARHDSERVFARHDGERVFVRIPVTARSEATRQSMDCFVPRNDGYKGFARNDGYKGFARNDGHKGFARHDVETGVLRGDTQIPVTARSEATRQSMDCCVLRNDLGLEG